MTPVNPHKSNHGPARAWRAVRHACSGLACAVREESPFRQELLLAACLVPLALFLPFTAPERLLLIGSVVLVLIVELLNSAIEAVVDRISLERHELSKRAKDYGSAAVLLSLLTCAMVWITLGYRLISR